jgi:hypothetical protein
MRENLYDFKTSQGFELFSVYAFHANMDSQDWFNGLPSHNGTNPLRAAFLTAGGDIPAPHTLWILWGKRCNRPYALMSHVLYNAFTVSHHKIHHWLRALHRIRAGLRYNVSADILGKCIGSIHE